MASHGAVKRVRGARSRLDDGIRGIYETGEEFLIATQVSLSPKTSLCARWACCERTSRAAWLALAAVPPWFSPPGRPREAREQERGCSYP